MKLVDFLVGLANDPERLVRFQNDPQGFLADEPDLTDEQRTLLLSRDASRIQHVLEYELGGELPEGALLGVVLFGNVLPRETPESS